MTNDEREQKDMVEISAKLRQEKLEQFLKDFVAWRNGPEGPEVMFSEGVKLVEKAQELLDN